MYHRYDPDEYETVIERRPCSCVSMQIPCDGRCNGSFGIGQRLRPLADVLRIKAERQHKEEDAILAQADAIRARRRAG
jgi:hypothetical protein